MSKQKTIKNSIDFEGVGLHSGKHTRIKVLPAEINFGIKFSRVDIENSLLLDAQINNLIDSNRGTSIGNSKFKVCTIEHLLSSIYALGIDNLLIEIDGEEVPIVDGSALPFYKGLKKSGIVEQEEKKKYISIDNKIGIDFGSNKPSLYVFPSDSFKVTFFIDYDNKPIGSQYYTLPSMDKYEDEIAPARTFCYFSEIFDLFNNNLIKGASLDNSNVFLDKELDDSDIKFLKENFNYEYKGVGTKSITLNDKSLRYENEPVRHKILDLIGDICLLGRQLKGHVVAFKSGHTSNLELVKKIAGKYVGVSKESLSYSIESIIDILPHRYPFLMIDRIIKLVPGKEVHAIKNVTINEPFFQGHFPGQPVMPGVLILEAMAQAGGFLILHSIEDPNSKLMYFSAIKNSKFKKVVIPGDQMNIKVTLIKFRLGTCRIEGVATVNDRVVASAEMMASVVDRRKS